MKSKGEAMASLRTISVAKLKIFLNQIERYGVTKKDILKYAKIPEDTLNSPDNKLLGEEVRRLIGALVEQTQDKDIGLKQGSLLLKGFSNILGYILMNCDSIAKGWEKYVQYEKLVDETSKCSFKIENGLAYLYNTTIDEHLKDIRQFEDFKIAGILSYIKLLTGKNLKPKKVLFTYSKPKDTEEHLRIFDCHLLFDQNDSAIIFDEEALDIKILDSNEELLSFLEEHVKDFYVELEEKDGYTKKVQDILLEEIKATLPSVAFIAKQLSMSVRSLQMHLKKENTSYRKITEEIRKQLAEKYIKDNVVSIDEISYVLGFSESSSFCRAFKKWTGLAPSAYREQVNK